MHAKSLQLCPTLCDSMDQAPLSIRFFRQEYWSGLPRPPPGDLPHPGIQPVSLMSPALAGGFFTTRATCQGRRRKRPGFDPWVGKIPWRRAWQPTPVFLPGESHGQGNLVGHGRQGHTECGTAEVT